MFGQKSVEYCLKGLSCKIRYRFDISFGRAWVSVSDGQFMFAADGLSRRTHSSPVSRLVLTPGADSSPELRLAMGGVRTDAALPGDRPGSSAKFVCLKVFNSVRISFDVNGCSAPITRAP